MSRLKRLGNKGFETQKIDVEQQGSSAVHGPKPLRPPSGRGNVFFIGPHGSGKTALGILVGKQLGRPFTDEPDWRELAELVKKGNQVAAIAPALLAQDGVENLLHRGGKVFYLQVDAAVLASRLGKPGDDDVALREKLYVEISELEPVCMRVLHFILSATTPLEEMLESVEEKLQITDDV